MSRTQTILLGALFVVGLLIAVLVMRNPQPPLMPAGEEHAFFVNAAQCLTCHGPRSELPRGLKHPAGEDCVRCHGQHEQ